MTEGMEESARVKRVTEAPRVVIADGHTLFRTRLRHLLTEQMIDVLMDIHMPVMTGVQATEQIGRFAPEVSVVIVTISADERDVVEAVMAGACGYLLKDSPAEHLVAGIRAAARGESLVSPSIAAQLLRRLRDAPGALGDADAKGMTPRELEILRLLATGMENIEIADALYMSPKTVKNNFTRILKKLHLRNRVEAAVYATKRPWP